ncbi:MAG: hypothetical protein O2955_04585, partial [Planctomycetota bacterium]|nr:hypothetical protein [Planctomycetota bacterium]
PVSLANPSLLKQLKFFFATLLAFLALKSEGRKTVRLRLPPKTRFARADGVYPVSELCREFEDAARELAMQFDDRNDNSFYRDTMEGIPHLLRQIKPYPVPVRSRPSAGGDEV